MNCSFKLQMLTDTFILVEQVSGFSSSVGNVLVFEVKGTEFESCYRHKYRDISGTSSA